MPGQLATSVSLAEVNCIASNKESDNNTIDNKVSLMLDSLK